MKFCKDCKHYSVTAYTQQTVKVTTYRCSAPKAVKNLINKQARPCYLMRGLESMNHTAEVFPVDVDADATSSRAGHQICGLEGRWFEPKEKK